MSGVHKTLTEALREVPTYVLLQAWPDKRGRYTHPGLLLMRVNRDLRFEFDACTPRDHWPPLSNVPGLVAVWKRPWPGRIWRFLTGHC